jgi:hypothetical protein
MKDRFLLYLDKEVPNDVAHMNLNRKPNYNTFRGIWTQLQPKLKTSYDNLALSLVKCGIHEMQMKKIGELSDFFKDFLQQAGLSD